MKAAAKAADARRRLVGDSPIRNLELNKNDVLKPCPFCGSGDQLLVNTHTACYWISCVMCGAEMHGEAFGAYCVSEPGHSIEQIAIEAMRAPFAALLVEFRALLAHRALVK